MEQVVSEFKRIKDQKKKIDDQLKVIKIQSGYKQLVNDLTDRKTELFQYMHNKKLDEYEGIKKNEVLPSSVRKIQTMEKKREKVKPILTGHVKNGEIDDLIDKLVEV